MKKYSSICLLVLGFMFCALTAGARDAAPAGNPRPGNPGTENTRPARANNLFAESFDPEADSLFIAQIRHHLDSVRTAEGRPIVALALCGGGAKGAAEVGALQIIDSLKIPVDFVCGTSVGSLLGGMMASGYSVDFLDSTIRSLDWKKMLSDKISYKVIPLSTKEYKSKYAISIPFHYAKERTHLRRRDVGKMSYSDHDGRLNASRLKSNFHTDLAAKSLASSLPAGYVYGHNVNNFFSSITVGYHDSLDFVSLPIPFACVATEMVSGTAKHFGSGQLKTAMRSSMGIPALFSPVRHNGMVLVDGGTRNNFPADIARAVGADIIIGIDISDNDKTLAQINNVGTIITQFVDMLVKATREEAIENCTVYIRPDVSGYSSLSFNEEAIDTLMHRGRKAALECLDQLEDVKQIVGDASTKLYNKKAININQRKVVLRSISYDGMTDDESKALSRLVNMDISKPVGAEELERAVGIIQGSGAVESVSYSLLGEGEPFDLVFNCTKAPTHRIGLGVRFDTEVWAEVAMNLGLNTNRLSGPKLDVSAKLGLSQALNARFMLDYAGYPTFNVEADIHNNTCDIHSIIMNRNIKLKSSFWGHEEKIYISSQRWREFDLHLGINNRYGNLKGDTPGTFFSELPQELCSGDYVGAFLKLKAYTMDDMYFPSRGWRITADVNADLFKIGVSKFTPKLIGRLNVKGVIPFGRRVALIPDLHMKVMYDADNMVYKTIAGQRVLNKSYSYYWRSYLGGDVAGRYIDHQIPFVGMNNLIDCVDISYDEKGNPVKMSSYDNIAVLNADLRINVYNNLYLSVLGSYAHMAPGMWDMFRYKDFKDIFGAGLQLSYRTVVGPIKARIQWSDHDMSKMAGVSAYLSVGYNF